jgi:hypothetical protein
MAIFIKIKVHYPGRDLQGATVPNLSEQREVH